MKEWLCDKDDQCKLVHYENICGHGKEGPIVISYHPRKEGYKECYIRHVMLCWDKWQRYLHRYLPSITRLIRCVINLNISTEIIRNICDIMILHHDVGKLSENYQKTKNTFYRHEILSAFLLKEYVHDILSDEMQLNTYASKVVSSLISSAVYLHHEGLQISHRHYELRVPTYSYLVHLLSDLNFSMISNWKTIVSEIEKWALGKSYEQYFPERNIFKGTEVAEGLSRMIMLIDGDINPLALRLVVSSILQPLMISDNLAAIARGGKPSRFSEFLGGFET